MRDDMADVLRKKFAGASAAQEHFFTPGLPGIALPDCTCGATSSGLGSSHSTRCPRHCSRCGYLIDCCPAHAEANELFYGRGGRTYSKSGRRNNVEIAKACDHQHQQYIWKESGEWRCKACGELV